MSDYLYDGFHKIEGVEHNGKLMERLILKSAVAAIVRDENNKYCLVRQYRPALYRETWEIPAGVLDKALLKFEVLLEELKEECNIAPSEVSYERTLAKYYMVAGSSDATNTIYELSYNGAGKDQAISNDDVLEVKWLTRKEVEDMIYEELIVDAKTLMAFAMTEDK